MSIDIELSSSALPADARVLWCRAKEGINEISSWSIRLLVPEPFEPADALGAPGALRISDAAEGSARLVEVIVVAVERQDEGRDGYLFDLELAPPAWLLTLRSGYRVFQEQTTKEIVTTLLDEAGVGGDKLVWRLSTEYEKRLYCVMYGETQWAFVERLLAEEGISYWFDSSDDDAPQLVFADDKAAYAGITGNALVPYADIGEADGARRVSELEVTETLVTEAVQVRDYDVRAPDVFIEGKSGDGAWSWFDYPACVLASAGAETRAKTRLEQLRRHRRQARASSDCVRMAPGRVLEIDGASDAWLNGRWLIVGLEHEVTLSARNDAVSTPYRNRLHLVPAGEVAYRPDVPRGGPRVPGVEPAMTTGASGEEIHVDDLGRVKVRFFWDRSGVTDDKSSYWVRCLQIGMGGSMILPRVDWEVPVVYVDGNPDRPFVLGRVYNATMVVPYALPGGQATTSLQSATSPGGGSTNEIRMVDDGGSQEMFVHATKDQTVTVGGTSTNDVSVNETHDVGLSLIIGIDSSQSTSIGANQNVNVGTNYGVSVAGSRTETIGGMEANKVTANRVVAVTGGYAELIGALYGIQCNQSNTGVAGAFTQLVGGGLNTVGGLGIAETTIAARTELVGGSKSLTSRGGISDNVVGVKNITAGATTEKAGGKVVTKTAAAGSIKVGAVMKIKSGGPLVIEAPTIEITAATIKTKEIQIGGGALKIKKGTSTLKGNIKRDGHAKLGS